MSSDRLRGVRHKIERAKVHIREVEAQIGAFTRENRRCVRREDDADTGEIVHRVRFTTPIPDELPLVIGDAAHNLRTALDHLAWQLVAANGQTPSRDTSYPIFETAAKYATHSLRKVQGMAAAAKGLIERTQPYHAGNEMLGKLSELDNYDKHRLTVVAAIRAGAIGVGIELGGAKVALMIASAAGARADMRISARGSGNAPLFLEEGVELGRIRPTNAIERNTYPEFVPLIAFRDPQAIEGEPVLDFFSQASQLLNDVVDQFAPLV